MKHKIILILAVAAGVCILAGVLLKHAPDTSTPAPKTVASAPKPKLEQPAAVPPEPVLAAETNTDIGSAPQAIPAATPAKKSAQKKPAPQKAPLQDPTARMALSLVGADPDAEAYWLGAIYDTSLPDQEREDLMEDLNEDGLSDPKHPGPEDMPLILNRLALIERIAPTADPFMQEHLGEAYKDLNNLLAGKPVQ